MSDTDQAIPPAELALHYQQQAAAAQAALAEVWAILWRGLRCQEQVLCAPRPLRVSLDVQEDPREVLLAGLGRALAPFVQCERSLLLAADGQERLRARCFVLTEDAARALCALFPGLERALTQPPGTCPPGTHECPAPPAGGARDRR
jgi:hypothetical protein